MKYSKLKKETPNKIQQTTVAAYSKNPNQENRTATEGEGAGQLWAVLLVQTWPGPGWRGGGGWLIVGLGMGQGPCRGTQKARRGFVGCCLLARRKE